MTEDSIKVNIEIEIPSGMVGEIPLMETIRSVQALNDSTPETSTEEDSGEEKVVNETAKITPHSKERFVDQDPEEYTDSRHTDSEVIQKVSGAAGHYVLEGLRVAESKNGEERFMSAKTLYNEIPLVKDRFCDTTEPDTYISSQLGSLYKDGLVKRLPMVVDYTRGRAPYGYRLSKRGYEVCQKLGTPKTPYVLER